MASKIRGITIELGADTSEFQKGISGVNKEIKSTQGQLKDVNKLLKLDPKNTELLAQKQKLLAKGVEQSSKKLEELHDAEKKLKDSGVDKNSDQFMALRREIIATEQEMKSYSSTTDDASKKTQDVAEKGTSTWAKVGKGIAAVGTAVATATATAIAGIQKAVTETSEYADTVDKASIRMGISAEAFQELSYVAKQSGVEMSTLEKAAKKLEGTDINFEDAMKQIMALGTAEERSAKASELFGDSIAYTLSPMIEQSTDDYEALIKRANDLGLVLGGEDVKAGVRLGDAMSDVQESLKMMVVQLGAKLVPVVQNFVDKVIPKLTKAFEFIDRLEPSLTSFFEQVMPLLEQVAEAILPAMISLIEKLLPIITAIILQVLPPFVEMIQEVLPILMQIIDAILPVFVDLLDALLPILRPILQLIAPILKVVMAFLEPLLKIIDSVLPELVGWLVGKLSAALEWIAPLIDGLAEGIQEFFTNIPVYAKKGLNVLISVLNKMIDGINLILTPLRAIIYAVGELFGASWSFDDVKIPKIPMLAKGGFVTSGQAIVGEAGPELLSVQGGGAKVTPLTNNTTNYALGGVTINVTQTDGESGEALAYRISEILADQFDRKQAVFG